jgi:hypothetical protein
MTGTMKTDTRDATRIIACRVFKPALEQLHLARRYPSLRVSYLPPVLHIRPRQLEQHFRRRVAIAAKRPERLVCLYGDCFPDISEFCRLRGIVKVPGQNCYEILLGTDLFARLLDETAGTYFLERELILNFREYCLEPLELYDEQVRKWCFEHYKRLLYVRQPGDPDLMPRACELADFLDLSLEIRDADYSHLERRLVEVLQPERGGDPGPH